MEIKRVWSLKEMGMSQSASLNPMDSFHLPNFIVWITLLTTPNHPNGIKAGTISLSLFLLILGPVTARNERRPLSVLLLDQRLLHQGRHQEGKKTFSFGHFRNHLNPPAWPRLGHSCPCCLELMSKFKTRKSKKKIIFIECGRNINKPKTVQSPKHVYFKRNQFLVENKNSWKKG